jgi:phosphatidylglycerophosphatase A
MLIPAVWSATISERLLGGKDPRPVVIDEIVATPFALWPLWMHWPGHWVTWVLLFGVYRLMDYLKPWPACKMEGIKGGWGIVMDDIVSATYMGIGVMAVMRAWPVIL